MRSDACVVRELGRERRRRALRDLQPRGVAHGSVGRDEQHAFLASPLRREALEQGVGRLREADLERADGSLLPDAVEDDDAARAAQRHVARRGRPRARPARRTPRRGGGCSRRSGRGSAQASARPRWRAASNSDTPAATLTFSESTWPRERNREGVVACPAHARPDPLALGAEHEKEARGEIRRPDGRLRVPLGRPRPQRSALRLLDVAREVDHDRHREMLDRARRGAANRGGDARGAPLGNDDARWLPPPRRCERRRPGCADR